MSLDPTARESNIRDSIKKFFVDGLAGTSIQILFDKALATPNLQTKDFDKWVTIDIGEMFPGPIMDINVNIYCCSRRDNEYHKMSQVRDSVIELLTPTSAEDDTMKRISFYRSRATGDWTLLGAMVVQSIKESEQLEASDGSKFKVVSVRLRLPSKQIS